MGIEKSDVWLISIIWLFALGHPIAGAISLVLLLAYTIETG